MWCLFIVGTQRGTGLQADEEAQAAGSLLERAEAAATSLTEKVTTLLPTLCMR
jgi:hypothetical protein